MIVIGNEVLSGRIQDENLGYVGRRLAELGVDLKEGRVIPDEEERIVSAVNEARVRYDYVFTSGGIGPTHDDITADCIAKAFGVGIGLDPRAVAVLEAHYPARMLDGPRMRMARIPEGAVLVENPVSHAPGFRLGNVYVFAGVPSVMRAMFEGICHELAGGDPLLSRTVSSFLAEGQIAESLRDLQSRLPAVEIGSYPFYRRNRYGTTIVLRSRDAAALDDAERSYRDVVRTLGAEPIADADVPPPD
jgi:molybdenum cofactor synthesis domain-containing protein